MRLAIDDLLLRPLGDGISVHESLEEEFDILATGDGMEAALGLITSRTFETFEFGWNSDRFERDMPLEAITLAVPIAIGAKQCFVLCTLIPAMPWNGVKLAHVGYSVFPEGMIEELLPQTSMIAGYDLPELAAALRSNMGGFIVNAPEIRIFVSTRLLYYHNQQQMVTYEF